MRGVAGERGESCLSGDGCCLGQAEGCVCTEEKFSYQVRKREKGVIGGRNRVMKTGQQCWEDGKC
jgi:hypothetical protein